MSDINVVIGAPQNISVVIANPTEFVIRTDLHAPIDKNYFDFITNPSGVPTAEGVLSYNPTEKTLDLQQGNGVIQQIGQEQYWRGKNQTGSTITNASVVFANGSLGASGIMTIQDYIADGSIAAMYVLGVTTEDIASGADGFITTFGKIRGIDTTGGVENWQEGDVLYASPTVAGALTNIEPLHSQKRIPIAFVINRHAQNGTISVRVPTPDQNAAEVFYNNGTSGLVADTVQEAIDELAFLISQL